LIKIGEKGALTPHRLELPKYHAFVRSHVSLLLLITLQSVKKTKQSEKSNKIDQMD
jgi:hypothetical protein